MSLTRSNLKIFSPDFEDMGRIPDKFTGVGEDLSPRLVWSGVPHGTASLAVVCYDPDAPLPDGFTHWVLTGIPPHTMRLRAGGGSPYVEGINGWGTVGYRGPMPPREHGDHRYYFWVLALRVQCADSMDRRKFIDRFGEHVIEQARTVGTFSR